MVFAGSLRNTKDYNGKAWDPMSVPGYGPFHVFAIGALDAEVN